MTKSQKYLIAALGAFFVMVVLIFRSDLLQIANRPRVSFFLTNYIGTWGITVSALIFLYFLAKFIGLKPVYLIGFFVLIELTYIFVIYVGPRFLNESFKTTALAGHFKRVVLPGRSMVQFQEETAQYDPELFYILKPNSVSRFKSYEFDTEIKVNSGGVRDSDENMEYPEVIFLGDSFTMGWGVDENESFPRVFAGITGLKTLNTGISSYGTARESRIFDRFKTDSLKLLVVQYHDTDLEENEYYVKNKKLGEKEQYEFDFQINNNKLLRRYYFFKYLREGLIDLFTIISGGAQSKIDTASNDPRNLGGVYNQFKDYDSDYFKILDEIRIRYDGPIINTYTGSFFTMKEVIDIFKAYAEKNNLKNQYFLNLHGVLDETDYFFFDDHINAKGHQKIAKALGEMLEKEDILNK